jgi:hypothetical protein
MRRTAECSLLQKLRHEDILEELEMDQSQKKLEQYKHNWLGNVRRMEDIRPRGRSPQAKYTDRATAACRRS